MLVARSHSSPPGVFPKTLAKSVANPTDRSAQSASDSFEQKELDSWNERLRPELGGLTTPPTGTQDPAQEKVRNYLIDLIDDLAGPELTKQNLDLKVEVYTGDVPQAALDDDMSAEKKWNEEHPDREWPLRGWLGTPSGSSKPIYRLAVNLGLLRSLETRDELAFVLAQQMEILLDHDKRDPHNEETLSPGKSFINSGEMQAAADQAAISRMTEAGFNPRGALSALNKLYAQNPIDYPDDDLRRGLIGAAHGHEHQGMRVGLVQAEVESYVRKQHPSTAKEQQALPSEVKLECAPGYEKAVTDEASFQADYQNLALKVSGPDTPAWMFGKGVPPKELGAIALAGGTPENKEKALLAATKELSQNSELTPQSRIDGFLRLLLATDGDAIPAGFSSQSTEQLHQFLKSNADGWEAGKFMPTLQRRSKSLHNAMVRRVVLNETFQNMVRDTLPGLAEAVPDAWITKARGGKKELDKLSDLIEQNHSGERNSWPMAAAIDQATLGYIRNLDAAGLAQESGAFGMNRAVTLSNELLGLSKPSAEFQLHLREASSGLLEAGAPVREQQARLKLRPPYSEPQQMYGYLDQLGQSELWKSFSPEFDADFQHYLKDLAAVSTTQPGFLGSEKRPGALPNRLEQRVVRLLSGEQPKKALDFLLRHTQHDRRIKGHSPRRAWLLEAAQKQARATDLWQSFTQPDRAQHAELLKRTLTEGYHLKPEDLPSTSTEHLKALAQRVENDEFEPKREDYASEDAFKSAKRDYSKRRKAIGEVVEVVAPAESRLVLGRMALLGHNAELSHETAGKLDKDGFIGLLAAAEEAVQRAEATTGLGDSKRTERVGSDAGAFLMDGFLAVSESVDSLEQWHDLAVRTIDFSNGGLQARVGSKKALAADLNSRLESLQGEELADWMGRDKVLELLNPAQSSDLLLQSMGEGCSSDVAPKMLAESVRKLDERYDLSEQYPVVYAALRDKIADKAALQPSTVDIVFPKKERGVTDTNASYTRQARALSGLLAVARERSPEEQIDTIEYLMGRQEVMPAYLEVASEDQAVAPLSESLQNTRQELLEADNQTRVMIANSFLAGPSGVLRSEQGKEAVIDHFLKNLNPDNRELGEKIARGVLSSHGEADTLAVAFILGQKPEENEDGTFAKNSKLDEASILNRLFDAYGVPGIKMKQYLAFTSEFKDFKDAFENAQDASMPLNYYQVLKLVQSRFGDDWPEDLKIDRVLGSGSVNVAIRYKNQETGKREVVALGREDIEESTRYDFQRFHTFIKELTKTPEDREKFGYVLGLLNLIEASVALEFDKESAKEVQQLAYRTYKHQQNGWTIKSIDAYRVENLGLFMEEAQGRTARKVFNEDPDAYKEAMRAMQSAEFGVLKGQTARNNWWPTELFANPDFHDGQVLIDKEKKTATILDFGQAVPIDNEDRDAALDLLTIIGKGDSAKAAAKRLNKRYFGKQKVMSKEDLAPILERKDRMDCFIHLLSKLSQNGADVPLSSVHWILGLNRQMALGEKIGNPIDKQVRNMVINHKIGLPLGVYNTAHATSETVKWMGKVAADTAVAVGTGIINWVGGWFGCAPAPEQPDKPEPKTEPTPVTYAAWRPNFGGVAPVGVSR